MVAGAPYALQALPESVPVCIVSVELASPDPPSVKSVRLLIKSVVPLFR